MVEQLVVLMVERKAVKKVELWVELMVENSAEQLVDCSGIPMVGSLGNWTVDLTAGYLAGMWVEMKVVCLADWKVG